MSNASDTGDQPGATTHFGFRDVPEGEKAGRLLVSVQLVPGGHAVTHEPSCR